MKIRSAVPNDAALIAPLMYSSAENYYELIFSTPSKKAIDFIEFACKNDAGFWGYSITTVVEIDRQVVATVCSYPWNTTTRLIVSGFLAILRFYGFRRGIRVILCCLQFTLRFKKMNKLEVYVAHLGTNKRFYRKGLASNLMKYIHSFWKELGMNKSICDVEDLNIGSLNMLTKLGYKHVTTANFLNKKNYRLEKIL
ncbi:MAG: GNAT family N-acetyltransferase [Pseudomonadota bacterium]